MRDFSDDKSRVYTIANERSRLLAARTEINLSQGVIFEYFNPNISADHKEVLRAQLGNDLHEPFAELGYIVGRSADIGGSLLTDILLGTVSYDPSKGRFLPFVERVIRNQGISMDRKNRSEEARARAGYEVKRKEVDYSNALARFVNDIPVSDIVEREIPSLRLEAERKFTRVFLDYWKEFGAIPSNLHICRETGYRPAHVATRLQVIRMHLRGVILAEAGRMEGDDFDTLGLAW